MTTQGPTPDRSGSDPVGTDHGDPGRLGAGSVTAGIAAAAGSIAVITLVARAVGFGRWFAFSGSVGATCVGNVYQSVNAVPNVLFEIAAGGVLAAVAVPLVAAALARGRTVDADRTASALLTWALVLLVPLGLVVAVAAGPIAGVLLGAGCADEVALGTDMLRIFAIQIPLYGVAIVLAGVLQAHRRFIAAAFAPLVSSLVVIATYLAYRGMVADPAAEIAAIPGAATTVLAVGTTLGVLAMALPLVVPVRRAGIRLRPRLGFPEDLGPRVRRLAVAGLLGVVGQQLATLVVIRLANSRGGAGTLNVFTYAQAITLLPYAVLAVPLATAAFPALAGVDALQDPDDGADGPPAAGALTTKALTTKALTTKPLTPETPASRTLRRVWTATVAVGLLGAAVLVAVAPPLGRFFLAFDAGGRDAATAPTIAALADAVTLMAPAVLALAVIGVLSRAAYVRGHAVLAGCTVGLAWLGTVVLPLLVLDSGRADGPRTLRMISLGMSLGLLVGALVLAVLVGRWWGAGALSIAPRTLVAVVLGAGAGVLAGRLLAHWLLHRLDGAGLGGTIPASILTGVLAAAVTGAVAVGLALAVDPSVRALARRRPGVRGPEGQ